MIKLIVLNGFQAAIEASLNTIEFRLREFNTGSFPRVSISAIHRSEHTINVAFQLQGSLFHAWRYGILAVPMCRIWLGGESWVLTERISVAKMMCCDAMYRYEQDPTDALRFEAPLAALKQRLVDAPAPTLYDHPCPLGGCRRWDIETKLRVKHGRQMASPCLSKLHPVTSTIQATRYVTMLSLIVVDATFFVPDKRIH